MSTIFLRFIYKDERDGCIAAERTGNAITQAMISRVEAGEDNMTIGTLRGLARAFGCAVTDLLPEEDKRRRSRRAV